MDSLFSSWNHRKVLKEACRQLKLREKRTLTQIAAEIGVAPPYLSNVLAEKAFLSPDQAHRFGVLAGWSESEINHFLQLLEFERSGDAKRRASLKSQIEVFRQAYLRPKQHLQKQAIEQLGEQEVRYFLNPLLKVIHGLIGVRKYGQDPNKIAEVLRISRDRLQRCLGELEKLGFVKKNAGHYEKIKKNFHLDQASPLCEPHQKLFLALAEQHVQNLPPEQRFQFMVTFSANSETQIQIREELMQFLKKVEQLVKAAPSEELYELKIDMFPWG